MADQKISQLTTLDQADIAGSSDLLAIVDFDLLTTKKATPNAVVLNVMNAQSSAVKAALGGFPTGDIVGTSDTQSLSAKTLVDPAIEGAIKEEVYTISDGAAFEIDPSNGSIQVITLGDNRTPKATNFVAGESVMLMIDDGTAYAITWTDATFGGSGVVWKTNSGSAPTLNTSGYTVVVLWKVGSQVYGARVGDA